MGCSSGSSPSFQEIMLKSITAADAVTQLADLTSQFLEGDQDSGAAELDADVGATDSPLLIRLTKARAAAEARAEKAYKADFPSTPLPAGQVDSGVVLNYTTEPGNLVEVIGVLQENFRNWNLIAPSDQLDELARTLAVQVNAQLGAVGVSDGSYAVGSNEVCQWVVSYGLITQDDDGDQALVYGFAADQPEA